ncbi:MAG: hypothetical protein COA97_13195 [Flavobacteriales bacterium]|nr:MAG: hypothetical protein COA97_13195 [Flavobacteriales bacterium]
MVKKKIKNNKKKVQAKYFFIDESGDPQFYGKRKKSLVGKPGYQPILMIGMIRCSNRVELKKKVVEFQNNLLSDPELKDIHSLHKKGWFLHARGDHPKVRQRTFEFISTLDVSAYYNLVIDKYSTIYDMYCQKKGKHFHKGDVFNLEKVKAIKSGKLEHKKKAPLTSC